MWAIIGGTGFESFSEFNLTEELERETPFGLASSGANRVNLAGEEILFISRHGRHHELSPTEVNYRANIFLLKKLGATKILSFSSVGSLREELKPGDLVIPTQYIDHTKGIRKHTFTGNGLVSHVSLAEAVNAELVKALKEITKQFDFSVHFERTSITIEGPAYSTKAEARYYQMMGADIIGMTNFPEYALAREAGLDYLPCSFVTDYDCWRDNTSHVTVQEVAQMIRQNRVKAFEVAKLLIPATRALCNEGCLEQGIRSGLTSNLKFLSQENLDLLAVLAKPSSKLTLGK